MSGWQDDRGLLGSPSPELDTAAIAAEHELLAQQQQQAEAPQGAPQGAVGAVPKLPVPPAEDPAAAGAPEGAQLAQGDQQGSQQPPSGGDQEQGSGGGSREGSDSREPVRWPTF